MSQATEDPGTPLTNAVIARLPELRPRMEGFVPDGWDTSVARAPEDIALLPNELSVPITRAVQGNVRRFPYLREHRGAFHRTT